MVTGLDAGRWNARGLVLVPRIPQAQVRREGLPPTRLRRVPIGKQRRMPRQSPAWRKLRSREGSTYIVDYIIPVWGTSVETNSPHASSRCQAAYRGHHKGIPQRDAEMLRFARHIRIDFQLLLRYERRVDPNVTGSPSGPGPRKRRWRAAGVF